jgi:hypothetical protein
VSKQKWLDAAQIFDTWRIVPRIVLFAYGWWAAQLTDWIVRWYEKLPSGERTGQVTAFVTIVLPGVFGLAVWVYKLYGDGATDWSARGPHSQTTNVHVETTVPAVEAKP